MNFKALTARFALVVSCGLMMAAPAAAQFWQCAPYARTISGIEIRGNANTWWGQAQGRYERGHTPKAGAVLAFTSTARMRVGHVAMVSKVVSDREVLLTHANWSRRGGIETNVRAIDVSASGDWSMVKVWYGPQGGLGTSSYPTSGFIYSGHAPKTDLPSTDLPSTNLIEDAQPMPSVQFAHVDATRAANLAALQASTSGGGANDPRHISTLVDSRF